MRQIGFKLDELILTQEIINKNEEFHYNDDVNKNLPEYCRLGYDLLDLKNGGYDFITPDDFNIANIFETGFYTYGKIKEIVDTYDVKDTRYAENLKKIKTCLSVLKNAETATGNMCKRSMGFLYKLGSASPDCTYDKSRLTQGDVSCTYKSKPA
jgi:hypothetical protein